MLAETLDVEPGTKTVAISFKEIRLDASLAVVHKHGMGSCRGSLVASPRGIRYETSNENDRFSAALTDVEELEFDYLDNNLRIKVRGGRTYNFAGPASADPLYGFYQDVDKVLARLGAEG